MKTGPHLIALPGRGELHAIPDLVEAFAHPLTILAPSLPFLTIAGAALLCPPQLALPRNV